jgi:hypothetical protein
MFPYDLATTHEAKKLILQLVKAKLKLLESQKNRKNRNNKNIQSNTEPPEELITLALDDTVFILD